VAQEVGSRERWQQELEQVERRLQALGKQQQRLIKLYRYGEIDDAYLERELKGLAKEKERLSTEKRALQAKLEEKPVTAEDVHAVMRYCDRVARNLAAFSVEEKRTVLETLQVRVAVEHDRLLLDGVLPLSVASTHSGEGARG
jgi:uncharacterized protein YPO0396